MYLLISLSIMPPILFIPTVQKMCRMCNRRRSRTQSSSSTSHLLLHLPEVASKQLRTALLPNMPMQLSNDFKMSLIPGHNDGSRRIIWCDCPERRLITVVAVITVNMVDSAIVAICAGSEGPEVFSPLIFSTAQRICCCSVVSAALESFYPLTLMASVSFTFVSGFASHAKKKYVALFAWSLGLRGSTQVRMYLYLWVQNPPHARYIC